MWLLLFPGIGLIPLLIFCMFSSRYGTREDFSAYRQGVLGTLIGRYAGCVTAVFPFVSFVYAIYRLVNAEDSFGVGLSASMLSVNFMLCLFTLAELRTGKFGRWVGIWKVLQLLIGLSSAMLSILFYRGAQGFFDALFTVYAYCYVMIAPCVLAVRVYRIFAGRKHGAGGVQASETSSNTVQTSAAQRKENAKKA